MNRQILVKQEPKIRLKTRRFALQRPPQEVKSSEGATSKNNTEGTKLKQTLKRTHQVSDVQITGNTKHAMPL